MNCVWEISCQAKFEVVALSSYCSDGFLLCMQLSCALTGRVEMGAR